MRFRIVIPLASVLLLACLAPAWAEGRWSVGLFAGQSVSTHHGSALDARALAVVNPLLCIGVETGAAYMNDEPRPGPPVLTAPGDALASLSDGITRNRGYYLGPAVKVGDVIYAIASTGLYEFADNSGHVSSPSGRWGASAGLGISGRGRFQPAAEVRYRWSRDATNEASSIVFALGLHIQ